MFTRKSIIQKTLQVGKYTLLSRLLGLIRDTIQVWFLGATGLSDAYITAWKVPNSLRKLFAEGALSASLVPTLVQKVRVEGRGSVGKMVALSFIVFESIVLLICALAMLFRKPFIAFIAPGFSPEKVVQSSTYLFILMPFIFFISTSALLASALQSVGHFLIPALGPVLLNVVYIGGLIACIMFKLPVEALCWFSLLGGVVHLIAHVLMYIKLQFRLSAISKEDVMLFIPVLCKFFLCLLSMSVMELGLFIDTSFGSLLSEGSLSLIYYANRWMAIPLGVFAIAFSTILLPHFSRVSSYAPRRLGFYVLEATKLVWWLIIPVAAMMMVVSHKIFATIYLSSRFTMAHVDEAAVLLVAFLCGLFFFAINKILLNVYYSLHHTLIPGLVASVALLCNFLLNKLFIGLFYALGLVIATTISGIIQTILLLAVLHYGFRLPLYLKDLAGFVGQSSVQFVVIGAPFLIGYKLILWGFSYLPLLFISFFVYGLGFWFWALPLMMMYMASLYYTNPVFRIRLLFIE